jgi:cytochrome c biogenesis protein CcmG, thiol:disulfide interchange protein DsbE
MKRVWLWIPLIAFVTLAAIFALTLRKPDDGLHRSKMIGKPLPEFTLPAASSSNPTLLRADFKGKPRLLNIFASWCIPCIAEAPVLKQLAAQGVVIEAVAIRDKKADVDKFLARNGNPYRAIGSDVDSTIQLAMGSSGVPETFVIDGQGLIRHQHIGDIRADDIPEILAALKAAE